MKKLFAHALVCSLMVAASPVLADECQNQSFVKRIEVDRSVVPDEVYADNTVRFGNQVVSYRDYDSSKPAGCILMYSDSPYQGDSFVISGEANSRWFFQGLADGFLFGAGNRLIWRGEVQTDGRGMYDMMAPFKANVQVADYVGTATFVVRRGSEADVPPDEARYFTIMIE